MKILNDPNLNKTVIEDLDIFIVGDLFTLPDIKSNSFSFFCCKFQFSENVCPKFCIRGDKNCVLLGILDYR